jgi:L,D-peptidoglycan transpeptidase YkuD (ErfK/YbiS/YcfS/YnhG family)
MHRFLAILLFLVLSGTAKAFELPAQSTQLIVGTAADWDSSKVKLSFFERQPGGPWQATGFNWTGRLGKNGLVWGRGLHPVPAGAKMKIEGDRRAPAGVFDLGGAWGYAPTIQKAPSLSYVQVTTRDLWFEDVNSPHYNQYLRIDHEPATPEEKKAQMKQGDQAHSLKLFIVHNAYPNIQPGAGSSIFFHIWRNGGNATTFGCTTMSEENLKRLIATINPERRPLYVLMPEAEYAHHRMAWKLP